MKAEVHIPASGMAHESHVTVPELPEFVVSETTLRILHAKGGPIQADLTGFLREGSSYKLEVEAEMVVQSPTTGERFRLVREDGDG